MFNKTSILAFLLLVSITFVTMTFAVSAEGYSTIGDNMLINSGFETGNISPWTSEWSPGVVINSNNSKVRTGSYSGYVAERAGAQMYGQGVTVAPNKTYIASTWLMTETIGWLDCHIYPQADVDMPNETGTGCDNWGWKSVEATITTGRLTTDTTIKPIAMTWSGYQNFYIDDTFFGELIIGNIAIGGQNNLIIPAQGNITSDYSASILNQIGTTTGLNSEVVSGWAIEGSPSGISIDQNGLLTIDKSAESGTIKILASCTPHYLGATQSIVTGEFYVDLKGIGDNMLLNSDFETGTISPWTSEWSPGLVINNSNVRSGSFSGYISGRSAGNEMFGQGVTVAPNKTYISSTWGKAETSGWLPCDIYAQMGDVDTTTDIQRNYLDTSEWKRIEGTIATSRLTGNITIKPIAMTWWGGNLNYFIDDTFFGELVIGNINIAGQNIIKIPEQGNITSNYSATILNQVGTNTGLRNETISEWSIGDGLPGVSIDQNGTLTVDESAGFGIIKILAKCTPQYLGAQQGTVVGELAVSIKGKYDINVVYKKDAITVINSIEQGNIKPELLITNNDTNHVNLTFISALFKKSGNNYVLVDSSVKSDITLEAGQGSIICQSKMFDVLDPELYIIKSFVWDDNMMPLVNLDILK